MSDLQAVVTQINQKHREFEADLRILKVFVSQFAAVNYLTVGITETEMKTNHRELKESLRKQTYPGMHPADADDWAAVFESAATSLLNQIEATYRMKRDQLG